MNQEAYIHALLCNYIRTNYPDAIFTTDLSGVRLPMGLAKKCKPLKSGRGIPDLLILCPLNGWHGLLIEVKTADADQALLKNGQPRADAHLNEQLHTIQQLRTLDYFACFVHGFAAGRRAIEDYFRCCFVPASATLPTTVKRCTPPLIYL
jgi:hypothetical protein